MTECAICLSLIKPLEFRQTFCSHVFHKQCIEEWFEGADTCPICRGPARIITPFPMPVTMNEILGSLKTKRVAAAASENPLYVAVTEMAENPVLDAICMSLVVYNKGIGQGDYITNIKVTGGAISLDGWAPKTWLKCTAPYADYRVIVDNPAAPDFKVEYDLYFFTNGVRRKVIDIANKACIIDGNLIYHGHNLYLTNYTQEQLVNMAPRDLAVLVNP